MEDMTMNPVACTTRGPANAGAQEQQDRTLPWATPRSNIQDLPNSVVLTVDLPGVDEQALELNVENGVLRVEGRSRPEAPAGYERARIEYGAVRYQRAFQLSDHLDPTAIEAKLVQGVLRITIPKREEAKPRRIAVKAE
jgi:HSP20 family molecular chaperone IbpA